MDHHDFKDVAENYDRNLEVMYAHDDHHANFQEFYMQPAENKLERSCGAVVFRKTDVWNVLLIRHSRGRHISFPKGHVEQGETEKETALREVQEEIGLNVRLISGFRGIELYALPRKSNTFKQVVFYLAQSDAQMLHPQRTELRTAAWMPFSEAMQTLEFDDDRRILFEANEFLKGQAISE